MASRAYSPSPASPATRLKSFMAVCANGAPHSLMPDNAVTSSSPWLLPMKMESLLTLWNLTKRSSSRSPSCWGSTSSSCSAASDSALSKSSASLLTNSLHCLLYRFYC